MLIIFPRQSWYYKLIPHVGKLVIKCPLKPREDLWHLITNFPQVMVLLINIIVFSRSFQEHAEHVRQVFQQLRNHGVKPGKCKLFQREVSFLGRVISKTGHYIDPKATDAVTGLKDTKNMQWEKFEGSSDYYWGFIAAILRTFPGLLNQYTNC